MLFVLLFPQFSPFSTFIYHFTTLTSHQMFLITVFDTVQISFQDKFPLKVQNMPSMIPACMAAFISALQRI